MIESLSGFLTEAPFAVFLFAFGIPALLSVGMAAAAIWSRRNARALASLPETTLDLLKPGPALASGKVVAGPAVTAPLSGRRCVWCESVVDESVLSTTGSGSDRERNYNWQRISHDVSKRPIAFAWNGVTARVAPEDATVLQSGWSEWYGPGKRPASSDGGEPDLHTDPDAFGGIRFEKPSDRSQRFRYRERYIFAEDPLFVLGQAVAVAGKDWAFSLAQAETLPFLISTRSPGDVQRDSGMAAKGGLVMAGLFALVAALVAYARFLA